MSILNEFYLGNIYPSEKIIKDGGEYDKLNKQCSDDTDVLEQTLDEKQKELFDKIQNADMRLNAIAVEESYIDGFCTGAKIMLEVLNREIKNYV